jgi:hypothetical protein
MFEVVIVMSIIDSVNEQLIPISKLVVFIISATSGLRQIHR